MVKRNVAILNETGIHARPANLLVKESKKYASKIHLEKNGKTYDASSIMSILTMGAKNGDEITIVAEGSDEELAVDAIHTMFATNFGE